MDYRQIFERALRDIDANLQGDLSADALARAAGFSTYHFCKVFQWATGYPLMRYVRRRRLAFAAAELSSGRRIIDIAMDHGFETHSGFSKAFRRQFGCTPEQYRLHARADKPALPSLDVLTKYTTGGIVMEPRLIQKPAIRLAGYLLVTRNQDGENNRDIPAFWAECTSDGRMQRLHAQAFAKSHDDYGACFMENPETNAFEYLIGLEMKPDAVAPAPYETRELPAASYAVFETPPSDDAGFAAAIQGTWQFIFNEWFPASGYEYAPGGVDFELYAHNRSPKDAGACEIHIPVIPKQP